MAAAVKIANSVVISGFRRSANYIPIFWDTTQRAFVAADISGQRIGAIYKVLHDP